MLNKSLIIASSLCIIAVIALITGIYNIVIYQYVSNSLATGNLVNMADTTTATKTADTPTSTTTVAFNTTPVSTDVITTNPPEECQRTLPFGPSAGDVLETEEPDFICFNSTVISETTVEQLQCNWQYQSGYLVLKKATLEIQITGIYKVYSMESWDPFFRVVSSEKEKEAIACLVKNRNSVEAYVMTWTKIKTQENEEDQVIQLILASLGQSATYIIRIYSDTLPTTDMIQPVRIIYSNTTVLIFFEETTLDDVRGKRQIFDLSHDVYEDKTLTVVEEGNNCRIFC